MTQDQKEMMADLTHSEQWDAVLAYVNALVSKAGEKVLCCDPTSSLLAINKARFDGATALALALEGAKAEFNKKEVEEKVRGRQYMAKVR